MKNLIFALLLLAHGGGLSDHRPEPRAADCGVDALRILADIVQRAKVDVAVTVDLLTAAGDRARNLLDKRLHAGDPRTLDVRLDLAGLAAGGYRGRVTAQAGASRVQREIGFVVRRP